MTIYKYNVPGIYDISLIEVLTAQIQNGKIVVWCIVNEEENAEKAKYVFDYCGTGHNIDKELGKYIDTVQEENTGYVWHIFYEKIKDGKKDEITKREYESQS